jgi:hypothetical protein
VSGFEILAAAAIVGGVAAGAGAIYSGMETKKASDAAAKRSEAAGRSEFAASQREAEERKLEGALVMSRQQAAAAASGAGAGGDAPTIVRLMTETSKRATYGAETTLYGGQQRRQTYLDTAEAQRASGNASFLGSIFTGVGRVAEAF